VAAILKKPDAVTAALRRLASQAQDDTGLFDSGAHHNRITMFCATWSWLVPIAGAAIVFAAVLLTTPPGFRAIGDIVLGTPRGPSADAAAYALGAAGSLALLTLLVLGLVLGALDLAVRRRRSAGRPRH